MGEGLGARRTVVGAVPVGVAAVGGDVEEHDAGRRQLLEAGREERVELAEGRLVE